MGLGFTAVAVGHGDGHFHHVGENFDTSVIRDHTFISDGSGGCEGGTCAVVWRWGIPIAARARRSWGHGGKRLREAWY